jgi:hypothetical protein
VTITSPPLSRSSAAAFDVLRVGFDVLRVGKFVKGNCRSDARFTEALPFV